MDKPKMIEITDHHELARLWDSRDDLNMPTLVRRPGGALGHRVYADASELRAWRALQSQSDGGSEHG